jgi:flagellar hook-associated protein 2
MSSPLQNIGGLASGLDTNTIITQLLQVEAQPKIKLAQHQTVEQARESGLSAVKTSLQSLQTALAGLRDVSTWGDTQSVDSSDSARVVAVRTGGAAAGGYQLSVTRLARAQQLTQGSSLASAAADDVLHLSVGGGAATDVSISSGDSIQTIADKVNGASGPLYASVSNGKLVFSSKTTGQANTISATSDNTLATDLGLNETISAVDASYSLNGGPAKTSASNTVTDAIVGVTLTLKGTTSSDVSVVVGSPAPDVGTIQSKIQSFVTAYNSTVDLLRAKVNQQRVAVPQNDSDRVQGVLEGDDTLLRVLDGVRSAVSDIVQGRPGTMQTLAQAGLSTGAAVGGGTLNQDALAGKLTLDTDQLTTALNANINDVKALFTNPTGSYDTEGLAQRLSDILTPFTQTGGIMDMRIQSSDNQIAEFKQEQSDWDIRLSLREQQLRSQFTAMETALGQAQNQGQWLTSQIAHLG